MKNSSFELGPYLFLIVAILGVACFITALKLIVDFTAPSLAAFLASTSLFVFAVKSKWAKVERLLVKRNTVERNITFFRDLISKADLPHRLHTEEAALRALFQKTVQEAGRDTSADEIYLCAKAAVRKVYADEIRLEASWHKQLTELSHELKIIDEEIAALKK